MTNEEMLIICLKLRTDQPASVEVENHVSETQELLKKHQIIGVNWIYNLFVKVIKMVTSAGNKMNLS